jgi:hypothetical protein
MHSLVGQAVTCSSILKENFSGSQYNPGALAFLGSKSAGATQTVPDLDWAKQFGLIHATAKKNIPIESHFALLP